MPSQTLPSREDRIDQTSSGPIGSWRKVRLRAGRPRGWFRSRGLLASSARTGPSRPRIPPPSCRSRRRGLPAVDAAVGRPDPQALVAADEKGPGALAVGALLDDPAPHPPAERRVGADPHSPPSPPPGLPTRCVLEIPHAEVKPRSERAALVPPACEHLPPPSPPPVPRADSPPPSREEIGRSLRSACEARKAVASCEAGYNLAAAYAP